MEIMIIGNGRAEIAKEIQEILEQKSTIVLIESGCDTNVIKKLPDILKPPVLFPVKLSHKRPYKYHK